MKKIRAVLMSTLFSFIIIAAQATAQEREQEPGVARISLMNGDVTTQRGDSGDWVAATVNAPVVNGDRVATAARSRAEVQLDFANILRLNENSQVQVQELASNRIQVQVFSGLVNYVVLPGTQADAEIATPNVSVRPKGEGIYRIEVSSEGQTLVTVRKGEAQISTPQGSATVRQGQKITARGLANDLEYRIDAAAGKDEWDAFNEERNNTIQNAQSYRYTNQYYTGVSDLDQHGRWAYVPGYDWCWTPYVNSGWAPYSDGRWTWEPYYGWTWVGYEPWGWAPYHYGRWFCHNSVWSWWPGPVWGVGIGYRPIWSPAYVSFFGFGYGHHNFGFGFGFGFGSIGWLPTGPCDPYVPWYGHGGWGRGGYYGHYNTVNVTNITNINNVTNIRNVTGINNAMGPLSSRANGFSNLQALQRGDAHVSRAFNMVSSDRFGQGNLRSAIQRPGPSTLREGRLVAGGLPVVPTRTSLSPSNRELSSRAMPRSSGQQQFLTRQQPSIQTQSFSQSVAHVQQMVQRQNSPTTLNENRSSVGTGLGVGAAGASRSVNSPFEGAGVSSVGASTPVVGNNGRRVFETAPGANGRNAITEQRQLGQSQQSWRRFGSQSSSAVEAQSGRSAYDRPGVSQQVPFRSNPATSGTESGSWRRFSSSGAGLQDSPREMGSRSTFPNSSSISNGSSSMPSRSRPGWGQFPAQSQSSSPRWAGTSPSEPSNPRSGRYSAPSSDRPPLDMKRYIVTPRSPSNSGAYRDGYSAPRGSYGGNVYSAPRSAPSGGFSAPRSYPSSPPQGGGRSGSWGGSHGGGGQGSSGGRAGGSSAHSGGGGRR
jgi:uncharacterized protein DUF6600/FecR-like protein